MNFSPTDLIPFWLSFKLAALTAGILLLIVIPLAWLLTFRIKKGKTFLETILVLPVALPPSVLGFYLLLAFSSFSGIYPLAFSFEGLLIASLVCNLPFAYGPVSTAFDRIPLRITEAAACLGKSPVEILWFIVLPLSRKGLVTGFLTAFAHTLGEFGLVLMIGGSIHGETLTASIAVYHEMEAQHYEKAHLYAGGLVLAACAVLTLTGLLTKTEKRL